MPNWCSNTLTVNGPEADVTAFVDRGIDFNTYIPYPETFKLADQAAAAWRREHLPAEWNDGPRDGYNAGGYEWCVEHWGTKWNIGADEQQPTENGPDEIVYQFDTAWSPPLPIVHAMADAWPTLTFTLEYREEGMGFLDGLTRGPKITEEWSGTCTEDTDE